MKLKKYFSLQTNKDRKMLKKSLKFKLKFNDVGTPKSEHVKKFSKRSKNA